MSEATVQATEPAQSGHAFDKALLTDVFRLLLCDLVLNEIESERMSAEEADALTARYNRALTEEDPCGVFLGAVELCHRAWLHKLYYGYPIEERRLAFERELLEKRGIVARVVPEIGVKEWASASF